MRTIIKSRLLLLLQLSLVITCLSVSVTTRAQPIGATSFFQPDTLKDARLSPDGNRIAMVIPAANLDRVMVFNTGDNQLLQQITTADGQRVAGLLWANDQDVVIAPGIARLDPEQYTPTGELFVFNSSNGEARQIAGRGIDDLAFYTLVAPKPGDPSRILVQRREIIRTGIDERPTIVELGFAPPAEGERAAVQLGERERSPIARGSLFTDNAGTVRLAVANSAGESAVIRFRRRDSDEWENIGAAFGAESGDLEPVGFSADNGRFFFLADGQYATRALKQFDEASGNVTTLLETEAFDINADDLVHALDSQEVLGVRLEADYTEPAYIDSDHDHLALQQKLDSLFPGERVQVLNSSKADLALIKITSPHRLGDFVLFNTSTQTLRLLGNANPDLPAEKMATANAFAIRNSAGLALHGYVTVPLGTQGPLPMIVIPDELPVGRRIGPEFQREVQFFAQHGFAVLQINARGAAGFGRTHAQAGFGQWGTGIIDDLTLAVRWAVQNNVTTADKVCLFGASLGAYAAVMSAIREPSRYQCAVAYSGVYDLGSITESRVPFLAGAEDFMERALGLNRDEMQTQSPTNNIDAIQIPLLIAHGALDTRAGFAQAEAFHNKLQAAGKSHEWLVKPDEAHLFRRLENQVEFYDAAVAFFNTHLQ